MVDIGTGAAVIPVIGQCPSVLIALVNNWGL